MSSNTKAGGKDVKETTASVKLNQMTSGMAPAQGNSVLLEAGGGDGAGGKGGEGSEEDEAKKRAKPALGAKKASKSSGPDAEACARPGHPVDAASGMVVDEAVEFVLPGAIPVTWQRSYSSARCAELTSLGRGGWCHSYDQWIDQDTSDEGEPLLRLRDGDGRDHYFESIEPLASSYHRGVRMTLTALRGGGYDLYEHETRLTRNFTPDPSASNRSWLREIRDRYGNVVTFTYEGGQLAQVTDTAGRQIRLLRDGAGRIIRIEIWASPPMPPLPPGAEPPPPKAPELEQWVDHSYHDTEELASVSNALGHVDRFVYDGHHRMVQTTLKNGVSFYYRYDEDSGRCIKTWGDGGLHRVDFQYDDPERATLISGTNEPRTFVYDAAGRIVEERTHDGVFVISRVFDEDGHLLSQTNAAGETIAHEYDAAGRRTKTIDAAGNETHWRYDGDLLLERLEPGDMKTTYRYDERGGLASVTFPTGLSYALLYDAFGHLSGIDGPDGPFVRLAHDDHHNLAQETDARGATTRYGHDSRGNARLRIDALGRRLVATHDRLGQPTTITFPDGARTEMAYEALGNLCRIVDALGQVTTLEYAGTGVIRRLVQPDGAAWSFAYDSDERLEAVINPRGERYGYEYDSAGRIEREATFDGRVIEYRYNHADRVVRVDYPDETWREFAYDPLGNIIEDRSPHGDVAFERDPRGVLQRSVVVEYSGKVENVFERDELGRVVTEIQQGRPIRYAYDNRARRASRTMPNGDLTEYRYDVAGALTGVRHNGVLLRIERNILGLEIRRDLGASGASIASDYDSMDRLIEQKVEAPAPRGESIRRAVIGRAFRYDRLGRVQRIDDVRSGSTSYRYDDAGHLVEAVRGGTVEAYTYDVVGSLVAALRSLAPTGSEEPWTLGPGNVLVKAGDLRFENDACGRRRAMIAAIRSPDGTTREERTEYDWDCRDRLREVRLPDGRRVLYTYDAFARRVRKEVVPAARHDYVALVELLLEQGADAAPKVTVTDYLWDGELLAADLGAIEASPVEGETRERAAARPQSDRDRPRAPSEQVTVDQRGQRGPPVLDTEGASDVDFRAWRVFVHEPRTFTPMLQSERGNVLFYVNDHLGLPKELVDEKGRLAWAARHTAWGTITEVTRDPDVAPAESPFRMLGQYADDDIGLCYTRFRWFDPQFGRWCSPDPLGLRGGTNAYAFEGCPTADIDPRGLQCLAKRAQQIMQDLHAAGLVHFIKTFKASIAVTMGFDAEGGSKKVVTTNDPQVHKALVEAQARGLLGPDESLIGPPVRDPDTGQMMHSEKQGIQHLQGEGYDSGQTGTTPLGCGGCQMWMSENAPGYEHQNPKPL